MAQMIPEGQSRAMRDELPWVVFRLSQRHYAVHSANIQGIMVRPEHVTPMPEMRHAFVGIISLRDSVLPLLCLRELFGMQSVCDEAEELTTMLEQRKEEHIHWVAELKRSVAAGEPFTLATDPHRCAFGKWYDHYEPQNLALTHQFQKIDAPHKKLHGIAVRLMQEHSDAAACQRLLQEADQCVAAVIATLDDSVRLFRAANRGMVITLAKDGTQLGVVVDEVLAVESLALVADIKSSKQETEYLLKVAKSEKIEGEILTVDDEQLLALVQNQMD